MRYSRSWFRDERTNDRTNIKWPIIIARNATAFRLKHFSAISSTWLPFMTKRDLALLLIKDVQSVSLVLRNRGTESRRPHLSTFVNDVLVQTDHHHDTAIKRHFTVHILIVSQHLSDKCGHALYPHDVLNHVWVGDCCGWGNRSREMKTMTQWSHKQCADWCVGQLEAKEPWWDYQSVVFSTCVSVCKQTRDTVNICYQS